MGPTENIRELAEPIVAAAGLELWDIEVGSRLVRVLVDRPAGVDLDALTQASRSLSAALDAHEELVPTDAYDLEVSSPGIERPLRRPDQFQRYLGSEVAVKVAAAVEGNRRLQGTLLAADDRGIVLAAPGDSPPDGPPELAVDYSNIQRAHVVASWTTAPSPRSGATRKSATAGVRAASGSAPQLKDA